MMKFESKPIVEHAEVPLADQGRWEHIVEHWQHRETPVERRPNDGVNRCYVVSVQEQPACGRPKSSPGRLAEILGLVKAQGDHIAGHEILALANPEPKALLGTGRARDVAARAVDSGADLLVVDAELTPSQMRNLEDIAGISVCDREAVILNVFLKHAKTKLSRIQVEIAHLEYLRPRIRGLGLDMDQQAGGVMRGRGPGETASELMARRLDNRLAELRKALTKLQHAGETQRRGRSRCKRIVLVGYTNAGKTSLMNALTGAGLSAKDSPFETLDTTTRCISRHGGDVLISDTVGVIRRLPPRLLASFESTLAEINQADLLMLVVDASDEERNLQLQTTVSLLRKLGAERIPRLIVFNKTDLLSQPLSMHTMKVLSDGSPCVAVSCQQLETKQLLHTLLDLVAEDTRLYRVLVPYDAATMHKHLYAQSRVLATEAEAGGVWFTVKAEHKVIERLRKTSRDYAGVVWQAVDHA